MEQMAEKARIEAIESLAWAAVATSENYYNDDLPEESFDAVFQVIPPDLPESSFDKYLLFEINRMMGLCYMKLDLYRTAKGEFEIALKHGDSSEVRDLIEVCEEEYRNRKGTTV